MPFTFRHPLYSKQRWPPTNALPSPLTRFTMMCVFRVCVCVSTHPKLSDLCTCSTLSRYSLLKVRRVKEGEQREEDGQTVEMALHQINVITALIRQPFNLRGARTERERDRLRGREGDSKAGREERKRQLRLHSHVCVRICPHLLSSLPPSFHRL